MDEGTASESVDVGRSTTEGSTSRGVWMAWPVRRRALKTPWWITASILAASALVTLGLIRFYATEDEASREVSALETASIIGQEFTRELSRFYTPTVSAEGFVAGVRNEIQGTDESEAATLGRAWPLYSAPVVQYLGGPLLDFQLAPEAIVTYSARPQENAAALGHNLLIDDNRRDQVVEAIAARGPIVAGPVNLLQGGRGLVIRQAVFLPGLRPFRERFAEASGDATAYPWLDRIPDDFWGMTTTVIDFDALSSDIGRFTSPGNRVGLFTTDPDGSLGEQVWGDLSADSAYTVEQDLVLLDGSRWKLRASAASTSWWTYWPVLAVMFLGTLILLIVVQLAYRGHRRNRIGYSFSEALSRTTSQHEVLAITSSLLSDLYPGIRGRITAPEPHAALVGIPIDDEPPGQTGPAPLEWRVEQSGELQCTIGLERSSAFDPREVDEVISLTRRILGASLAALRREGRLERRAAVDALTMAFNRTQLVPAFERLRDEAALSDQWILLACIDIDDFKGVNDTFGHLVGDEALKTLTATLLGSLRVADAVVRFGGDEFVVMAAVQDESRAGDLCERIQRHASRSLSALSEGQRDITVSLGYVLVPALESVTVENALAAADAALYEAKAAGRARVRQGTLRRRYDGG